MLSRLLLRPWARDAALGAGLFCAVLALLLWPEEGMDAAKTGLTLCWNVIIPSLFPFFVLSSLIVELGFAQYLGRALEGIMRPLFHVGGACASAVALGFIGGYPVGARTAINLYENGLCSKTEAERLLAFCNNSGPAFILGVVGAGIFSSGQIGLLLYLTHIFASLCVGFLFRFYKAGEEPHRRRSPSQFQTARFSAALTNCVKNSFSATLNICAFVIFFAVVIRMLFLSGILPGIAALLGTLLAPVGFTSAWAERMLTGLLEISSGVASLRGPGELAGRISMASFLLGWAGFSVHCQVLSFLGNSGLSMRTYFVGKMLHACLSALFIGLVTQLIPLQAPVSLYLNEQAEGLADLDFTSALTCSIVTAWLVWLVCFFLSAYVVRKNSGKTAKNVV